MSYEESELVSVIYSLWIKLHTLFSTAATSIDLAEKVREHVAASVSPQQTKLSRTSLHSPVGIATIMLIISFLLYVCYNNTLYGVFEITVWKQRYSRSNVYSK